MATEENTMDVVSNSLPATKNTVIRNATRDYLSTVDLSNIPSPDEIEAGIINEVKIAFDLENAIRPKGSKWKVPDELIPAQIADILLKLYPVANVCCAGENADTAYDILSVYQDDGPNKGIYVSDDEEFNKLVRQFNYGISQKGIEEVRATVKTYAPRVKVCIEKNLIAVNNGVFDYDTKKLLPFTPELVFTVKSKVDYNDKAQNVKIHNSDDNMDWDVESWMKSLSDDIDVVNVLWQVIGAIIRPNVRWGKSAWFYSETGNNGKGTLCELMRALCGDGSYASISLSEMGKDFMLEPLVRASAIIVDENDVGTYIDKAANLKAIITNDVIQINRKFKTPIAYRFRGFMVQCLNEMPRINDKSDSFYRRQLFIPFQKCFTGVERKYIKEDYLHRKEVLEYVLYKVLNMDYYSFTVPTACELALEEYKEYNDPFTQFMKDIMPKLKWNFVPFGFLYDVYEAWCKRYGVRKENNPISGITAFKKAVNEYLVQNLDWDCDTNKSQRPGKDMDGSEPLIWEYNLQRWMNPKYIGTDQINFMCVTPVKSTYQGIRRKNKIEQRTDVNFDAFAKDDTDGQSE